MASFRYRIGLFLGTPYAPVRKSGCPPFALEVMRLIHLLQQLFRQSEAAMNECLHGAPPRTGSSSTRTQA